MPQRVQMTSTPCELEWVNIGTGHYETSDGWWVIHDDSQDVWQFGFCDMPMGWDISAGGAKAACERLEEQSQ